MIVSAIVNKPDIEKRPAEKVRSAETALWSDQLDVLRVAIEAGKPGAVEQVKRKIATLDGQISALSNRREMVPQTLQATLQRLEEDTSRCRSDAEAQASSRIASITAQIDEAAAHMADLAKLVEHVRVPARDIDEGPTAEAIARPSRRDSIKALEEAEREEDGISHLQAAMARRIAMVHQAITQAGQAKIGRLDGTRGGGGYREPAMSDAVSDEHKHCYLPWATHLREHGPVTLALVQQIAVFGITVDTARRHFRLGRPAALGKLRDGLDLYSGLYRDFVKVRCQD